MGLPVSFVVSQNGSWIAAIFAGLWAVVFRRRMGNMMQFSKMC